MCLRICAGRWAHTSKLTCHPGMSRTTVFVQQRFWWPSLERDVREFVAACRCVSQHKPSHRPLQAFSSPSLYLITPGRTSHWTFSVAFLPQMETRPFSLLLIYFPRWPISSLCASCRLPRRLQNFSSNMFFIYMAYLWTLFQIGGPSSPKPTGGSFVLCSLGCLWVSIHSLMGRLIGYTRSWRQFFAV